MTPSEFGIVATSFRIGLDGLAGDADRIFRYQVERLARHLDEIGDRNQAAKLRQLLDPPPPALILNSLAR